MRMLPNLKNNWNLCNTSSFHSEEADVLRAMCNNFYMASLCYTFIPGSNLFSV